MFVLERKHLKSRFILRTIDGICDCTDIILQIAEIDGLKTGAGKAAYLCEVISPAELADQTSVRRSGGRPQSSYQQWRNEQAEAGKEN